MLKHRGAYEALASSLTMTGPVFALLAAKRGSE